MSTRPRRPLAERLYRRAGSRYPEVLIGLGGAALYALTVIHVGVVTLFLGEYASHAPRFLGEALLAVSVVAVPGLIALFRIVRPAIAWLRGTRTPGLAEDAWTALVARLPRMIALIDIAISIAVVPVVLHASSLAELNAFGTLMLGLFASIMTFGGGVLVYLANEQLMRPLVHDIALALPADFAPPLRTVSLGAKLLGLLLAINVYTAMLIAGLSNTAFNRETRIALAAVISLTLPLVLTLLVRRSLLVRLRDIQRAFERVRRSDLEARLPNVAGDELDEVGHSFNLMVRGLREREGLHDELRSSRARIVTAADESRRGVERDLHDGAQQHLVLLKLKLGLLERTAATDPAAAQPMFADVRAQLDRALAELRDLAHGIYPPSLTNDGLCTALQEAAARCALPVRVECEPEARYPADVEAAVYFCCVEALQNAAKYAGEQATAIIVVDAADGHLRFEVADDGHGFDPAATNGNHGLLNMADRLGALGGTLDVESAPGQGARVTGRVPVREDLAL